MSHRKHGTHAKYVVDKCRCAECREATRLYEHERVRRVEPAYVGADRARQHIKLLAANNVGLNRVAARSGVSHGALSKLMYGDRARGRGPSKRIRRDTEQKILAVTVNDAAGGSRVPAGPTWDIIDTLIARGWQKAEIGRRVAGPQAKSLQISRDTVSRRNAATIRALLDEPVPPRRSRHGLHEVAQPEPEEIEEAVDPDEVQFNLAPIPEGVDLTWRTQGACRRPDAPNYLFFPARGDTKTARAAKAVCARCPVHEACLEFALIMHEDGIWGGTTEKERRRIRRERRETAA